MTEQHVTNAGKRQSCRTTEQKTVNLLNKKLKVMVIKTIKELQRKIEKQSKKLEVFKEELENKKRK